MYMFTFTYVLWSVMMDFLIAVIPQIVGSNIQYTPVHYGEFTGFDTIQVPSGEVVLEVCSFPCFCFCYCLSIFSLIVSSSRAVQIIVNGTTYTHEPGIIKMGSIYLLVVGGQTGPSGTTTVPMPLLVYDQPTYGKFRFGHFLPNAADLDVIIDDQVVGRVNFGNLSDEIQVTSPSSSSSSSRNCLYS